MNIQLPIENTVKEAIENAIEPLREEIKSLKQILQNFEHSTIDNISQQEMLLTDVEVAKMLGIGKSTVWHKIRNEQSFPKPIKMGNATHWSKKRLSSI